MNVLTKFAAVAASSLFLSVAALASTTTFGELSSDAGTYSPIALGDDLELDGCGSDFVADGSGTAYGLCNGVTDLSEFDFTWIVYDNTFAVLGSVAGVTSTLTTGGIGDLIATAGSYFVSLNVTLSPSSSTFALPGGLTGGFLPTPFNPDPNSDTAFTSFVVTSVPEPAAALLLAPALLMVARRQRRRRKDA